MGCGIAGLTSAHYLQKHGFNVTIYERNEFCGGLARTRERDNQGNKVCPSEHSWRVFTSYYHNILSLMEEIPNPFLGEGKSVRDYLIPTSADIYSPPIAQNITRWVDFDGISSKEWIILWDLLINHMMSSNERNIEEQSDLGFYELLKGKISDNTYSQVIRSIGPYFGLEGESVSCFDLLHFTETALPHSHVYNGEFYITNLPTSMAWFNPWTKYLRRRGVLIYENSAVEEIKTSTREGAIQIDYIVINGTKQSADYYVSAISLESLIALTPPELANLPTFQNLEPLYARGRQVALSMQFYLSRKAKFNCDTCMAYMRDAPWGLIITTDASAWGPNLNISEYCGDQIHDIWSVSVLDTFIPGILQGKTFLESTPDEIAKEVWHQIMSDREYVENVYVEGSTPSKQLTLDDVEVVDYRIWEGFYHNGTHMNTWEPKWSNNVGTRKIRPKTKTEVSNLYIGTAYTQTAINLYGMEGAVESGMSVAHQILKANNIFVKLPVADFRRSAPLLFGLPRFIDTIMFKLNIPSLSSLCGHAVVALAIFISMYLLCFALLIRLIVHCCQKRYLKIKETPHPKQD